MITSQIITEFSSQLLKMLPKFILGLLIMLLFWIIGIVIAKITIHVCRKTKIHKNVVLLLGRIARTVLVVLGIISALGTMGGLPLK